MTMQVSRNGALFIAQREALVLVAYQDPDWTKPAIGFGHNSDPKYQQGSGIDIATGFALLKSDLAVRAAAINKWSSGSLSQTQFDALMSLYYNFGTRDGAVQKIAQCIHVGNMAAAAATFLECINNSNGEFMIGLLGRRLDELRLFVLSDYGPLGTVMLWRGDPKTTAHENYTVQAGDI